MSYRIIPILALVLSTGPLQAQASAARTPDIVLQNGRVFTGNATCPYVDQFRSGAIGYLPSEKTDQFCSQLVHRRDGSILAGVWSSLGSMIRMFISKPM